MEKEIFISYSNQDKEVVSKVVRTIENHGVSCWFQLADSRQNYVDEINNGINQSSTFVVFLSNASIQSIMVRNEIVRAITQTDKNPDYAIVPIVLQPLDPANEDRIKLLLGSLNWLFWQDYADADGLVLAIFDQAGIKTQQEVGASIYSAEKDVEKIRLAAQNRIYNAYAIPPFRALLARYEHPVILDVGCDNGDNILLRVGDCDYRYLVGVDISEDAIATAQAAHGDERTRFAVADVTAPTFVRNMYADLRKRGIYGFDVIHVASVLMHLSDVDGALNTLMMLLNPGGVIFVQEEDDGANMVYPPDPFFDNCFYVWMHSRESGNRLMGRTIPIALRNAGFANVRVLSSSINCLDHEERYREDLWDLYFNIDLWATDNAQYFDDYKAFSLLAPIRENHSKMKANYMAGDYFIALGVMFFVGEK